MDLSSVTEYLMRLHPKIEHRRFEDIRLLNLDWYNIVNDAKVEDDLKLIEDRKNLAFFSILFNKTWILQTLWGNTKSWSEKDVLQVLEAFTFYHNSYQQAPETVNALMILQVILETKLLEEWYPKMLTESSFDHINVENITGLAQLRMALIQHATKISGGTNLLYTIWSKYCYHVPAIWSFYVSDTNLDTFQKERAEGWIPIKRRYEPFIATPFSNICHYGNFKDFLVAVGYFPAEIHKKFGTEYVEYDDPIGFIVRKRPELLNLLLDVWTETKKVWQPLEEVIDWTESVSFSNKVLRKLFKKFVLTEGQPGYNETLRKLVDFFPAVYSPQFVKKLVSKSYLFENDLSKHIDRIFYNYNHDRIVKLKRKQLSLNVRELMSSTIFLICPLPVDGRIVQGLSSEALDPIPYFFPEMTVSIIPFQRYTLHVVLDVRCGERGLIWSDRITQYGEKVHSHWRGPYCSFEREHQDFSKYLESVRQKPWIKNIWWLVSVQHCNPFAEQPLLRSVFSFKERLLVGNHGDEMILIPGFNSLRTRVVDISFLCGGRLEKIIVDFETGKMLECSFVADDQRGILTLKTAIDAFEIQIINEGRVIYVANTVPFILQKSCHLKIEIDLFSKKLVAWNKLKRHLWKKFDSD